MQVTGNIPKEVTYFPRNTIFVGFEWDDDEEKKLAAKIPVRPAYCSDAVNKKTIETGKSWQSHQYGYGDKEKKAATDEIKRANDPISGIRVVSLEVRSEGGRAYNVVTPDGYYFDLREDVLLDTMLNDSIKGGILGGSYVWGKVGSQMKLVRVGSELHEALIDADARHRNPPVAKTALTIGQVYRNKKREYRMFLGDFATLEVETEEPKNRYSYGYTGDGNQLYLGVKEHKKVQVWLEIPEYYFKSEKKSFDSFEELLKAFVYEGNSGREDSEGLTYHMHFVKEGKVTDMDSHKLDLPADYVEQMQTFVQKYWRISRKDKNVRHDSVYDKGCYSRLFHLVPVGEKPVLKPEFER